MTITAINTLKEYIVLNNVFPPRVCLNALSFVNNDFSVRKEAYLYDRVSKLRKPRIDESVIIFSSAK